MDQCVVQIKAGLPCARQWWQHRSDEASTTPATPDCCPKGAAALSGETDLGRLLAGLNPVLDPVEYSFESGAEAPALGDAFAIIREPEGVTVIAPGSGWARIMLGVHSSLAAVGLTARVAEALAQGGISANIVAAYHHDHVFVPWERRDEALAVLHGLRA